MRIAVYPGSFDPITNGHVDIIERASKMFDKLIVSVLLNNKKEPMFTSDERIDMIKNSITHLNNVEVDSFEGLLVNYLNEKKVNVVIRGLRAMSDFENEFQMALMNKKLWDDVETIFLITKVEYSYLSSSAVKEVAVFNGHMKDLVPDNVYNKLQKKLGV
ncbi:pantetheine-phosphate adenylyltransferase [Alkalibaculum sp. M08DMB]|uniref:Phosphopantetheine adenylyltransferase n=1 Tax=Alkalibaculum sporogenes TaxID=2655001 RepID=A0A6A7K9E4_9FIRM|nr:pantetheine-phosphate adenylyltransferase [Alkalibaculum sporogenes]MPW26044.1 pantetheine-phosphate adenylyltransferase [Alkalibaculum sporogenes]